MWSSTVLFNPTARVYNVRLLLSVTLTMISWTSYTAHYPSISLASSLLSLGTGCLILLHHISILFVGQRPIALFDLSVTVVEIIVVACLESQWGAYIVLLLAPLIVAAVFRMATIRASPERFWRQKFAFLGGCSSTNPPYTAWRILMNRSLGRPLVRGEFRGIIIVRALILSGVMIILPIFAVYSIIWIPLQAEVRTNTLSPPQLSEVASLESTISYNQNVTIALIDSYLPLDLPLARGTARVVIWMGSPPSAVLCPTSSPDNMDPLVVARCPTGWTDSNITISITFANPPSIFSVFPGVGDIEDFLQFTEPIPVTPGIQLFAYLKWTSRQIFAAPSSRLLGAFIINSLTHENDSLSSTLTLVQREGTPTKFLQDSAATPIDGISAFGGAWTFINGAFVLFFGANVLYFAFGGQPGSESAGIVAFIRERLVDIEPIHGYSETQTIVGDVESQEMLENGSNQAVTALGLITHMDGDDTLAPCVFDEDHSVVGADRSMYQLGEIPLLNPEDDWAMSRTV
ncbi:hypothetical protein DFH06DRAFT_1387931 [Mycena polygramma]|nr:hypothetical protein DFH06DRAFT_1387931 [Mycena polygramma]